MRGIWRWGAFAAALMAAPLAGAHELDCDKTIEGMKVGVAKDYPASFTYELTVENTHKTQASEVLGATDSLFQSLPAARFPVPFELDVGESESREFRVTVGSFKECLKLGLLDGRGGPIYVDNVFTVRWDAGQRQCRARLVCLPDVDLCDAATRTIGFFKTHVDVTRECLARGDLDFGFVKLESLEDALGLLWGSPNRFDNKARRSGLEKARFLLARQLVAGVCNHRLFGAVPTPAALLEDARRALCGTDEKLILGLKDEVDDFNNSGDRFDLPAEFANAPADPQLAQALADDPTAAGQVCGRN